MEEVTAFLLNCNCWNSWKS